MKTNKGGRPKGVNPPKTQAEITALYRLRQKGLAPLQARCEQCQRKKLRDHPLCSACWLQTPEGIEKTKRQSRERKRRARERKHLEKLRTLKTPTRHLL